MRKIGARILVIDDEVEIRRFLKIGLKSNDYIMLEAANGQDGLGAASMDKPDLIILDLGLPDMSGLEVLKSIREWSKVPVIVLSVRREEREKVEAFERGANDYVTKPFGMAELVARIRAQLRDRILEDLEETSFVIGDLEVDLIAHKVALRGERIHLTPKEYALLSILVKNEGRVIPHKQLIRDLWGEAYGDDNQYLRVYVRQLRRKIEKDRMRDQYIHTEPGIGYRLEYVSAP
ncbi:response regulator [Eilatimonas milleporae]|uniref:Two-component system KDP operon response regulator KdpE n=1 Tax=Eilatimonas milleporae TaxID=911205 RepID=A0A3M0CUG5_9PROT|nr:response regulator transcription factor [Eilatimonas milleporae]RMB12130.1 two-component system KDP operon response regulator KdpE [Eilatimonas milleporae]